MPHRSLAQVLLADPPGNDRTPCDFPLHARLTEREQEILTQLLRGWSVGLVSRNLHIAVSTTRMHVRNLHMKTETRSLHAMVLWAIVHAECCRASSGTEHD
jgi:DNA-binding NarL/FixJ family response regulator